MSSSDGSSSPDPLALPSSPLATRSDNRSSTKPPARRSSNVAQYSSPSKSFIMETGQAGDASPWRIKVTVEAEPKDGSSPGKKMTRTTKVPLKGNGSSSPAKPTRRSTPRMGKARAAVVAVGNIDGEEIEVKRPQRKRKGTPIRRRETRGQSATADTDDDDGAIGAGVEGVGQDSPLKRPASRPARRKTASAEPNTALDADVQPTPATSSTMRRPGRRESLQKLPTERSKRLSLAREELDLALQDAVGYSDAGLPEKMDEDDEEELVSEGVPGDLTVMDNEDFTMVSVETLQSMKQNTSLLENSGIELGDKSAVNASYWPSSPPQVQTAATVEERRVQYPDIAAAVVKAKSSPAPALAADLETAGGDGTYDAMSWKLTGPPVHVPTPPESSLLAEQQQEQQHKGMKSEPSEWQREREPVSRQIQNPSGSEVIVLEKEDAQTGAEEGLEEDMEDEAVDNTNADDIWAEEASRSLEQDQQHDQAPAQSNKQSGSRSPQLEDLFSDQPQRPPRPKIPRTWRRTSGMDFSYVDSPEHGALKDEDAFEAADDEAGSGSSRSRRSSGVLTPPSTDDEDGTHGEDEGEGDTSLTQPDAAGTLLQSNNDHGQRSSAQEVMPSSRPVPRTAARRDDVLSSDSDSGSDAASPSGIGDTGLFWQVNSRDARQRRRYQRPRASKQKVMDLSELLNLDRSDRAKKKLSPAHSSESHHAKNMAMIETGAVRTSPSNAVVASSNNTKSIGGPPSKPLHKSSKVNETSPRALNVPASTQGRHLQSLHGQLAEKAQVDRHSGLNTSMETTMDSFSSKASDQRQLLAEMASTRDTAIKQHHNVREAVMSETVEEATDEQKQGESMLEDEEVSYEEKEVEEEEVSHPTRSYEEHLNLDSPQKIRVKFGDSTGNSSQVAQKKQYPPLFGKLPVQDLDSASSDSTVSILKSKKTTSHSVTVVSKQPCAPPPTEPQPGLFSRLSTTFWSAVLRPTGPSMIFPAPIEEPVYSPSLRTEIRSRYGIVSDQHPWTMLQMRVLHRMLNSCTSNRYDSIIPKIGPLPSELKRLIGKNLESVTDFRWTFTEQHAHVVDAFMQVLVPARINTAMMNGDIEFVGDSEARRYRGWICERHGDLEVFAGDTNAKVGRGTVELGWVVKALGNCVFANTETAKKEVREAERKEAIRLRRREWERKNGIADEEDESLDE